MKQKTYVTGTLALCAMVIFILDSRCMLHSAEQGIMLCIKSLIPSLFPFLFLSCVITDAFWGYDGTRMQLLANVFRIPPGAASILIPAFLGGYPAGAQTIAENHTGGRLGTDEAQRLLMYCNNAGPAFLFGIVASQFPSLKLVWSLWMIHILSAAMVCVFCPMPTGCGHTLERKQHGSMDHLGRTLRTMGIICGWVILFRVFLGFLDKWFLWCFPEEIRVAVWGILELSNGCCSLAEIDSLAIRFILCAGMLSFGGICITMQTASLISDLSLSGYLKGKALQTGFSLFFAALTIYGYGWLVVLTAVIRFLLPLWHKKEVAFWSIPVYNAGITSSEGAI